MASGVFASDATAISYLPAQREAFEEQTKYLDAKRCNPYARLTRSRRRCSWIRRFATTCCGRFLAPGIGRPESSSISAAAAAARSSGTPIPARP
jgi:hypothetical protein